MGWKDEYKIFASVDYFEELGVECARVELFNIQECCVASSYESLIHRVSYFEASISAIAYEYIKLLHRFLVG